MNANLPAVREENAFELGKVFADSGMFPNVRKANEAIVKIIAGREFGLGPMAAMMGIHMVDGKPALAANLIAGQIKRHQRYDYKVLRREDDGCALEFFEDGQTCSRDKDGKPAPGTPSITWDKKDAVAAGLLGKVNWKKYPRDMYFARCLTAGARTYCPDVLGGSPIYTAEELGAEVSETSLETPETLATPEPVEVIADAEIVEDEPQEITTKLVDGLVLDQLRNIFLASGKSQEDLAWCLLSVGVESLPANPSNGNIGTAMRSLNLEQALRLEELLTGTDGTLPGSGETT